jgi:hypothetical protein
MNGNQVEIKGSYLYHHPCTNVQLYINNFKSSMINGTVTDPEGNPVPNAGIEIIKIEKTTNDETTVGCIFTDNKGRYAVTLKRSPDYCYKFKLYSQI